jgi:hypothetical protein
VNEKTVWEPVGKIIFQKLKSPLLPRVCIYVVLGCMICVGELYKHTVLALRDRRPQGVERNSSCLTHRDHADSELKPGVEMQSGRREEW